MDVKNRKLRSRFVVAGLHLLCLLPGTALAATVDSIEFLNGSTTSEVLVRSDAPLEYQSQTNPADKQVVITLGTAQFGARALRRLDTSSFDAPVTLVSPFKGSSAEDPSRLVVQLREFSEPEVRAEGNLLRIVLKRSASTEASVASVDPVQPAAQDQAGGSNLDKFMQNQVTKRFSGSPVTLQVRDTPLADVLTMIGEASGFNIILGEGVGGKITLSLVDVPWDQALDVVLSTKRLGAERRNNVLRITTLANLTAEKEELLRAKLAAERSAPRMTRIFPISFADIKELQTMLTAFSANSASVLGGTAAGAGAVAGATASIQVDQRTNSLIIQDTYDNLEKIRKLIELMDTQTPQVLIEAKVVEATEDFNKTINGQLGFGRINGDGRGNAGSFNGAPATSGLTGASITASQPRGGAIGYSPSIAFLPPAIDRLNLLISMLETEEKAKVISSPKTVVLNKKTAKILKGTPTTITQTIPSPTGNLVTQQVITANLSLEATPTVTNSGSVLMNLKISRDTVLNNLVAPRNLETEVLVDNGSTLVIGGIYSSDESKKVNGFPFLKDLPFVGWLFRGSEDKFNRSELFIFVTPKVLNEKEPDLIARPTGVSDAVPEIAPAAEVSDENERS